MRITILSMFALFLILSIGVPLAGAEPNEGQEAFDRADFKTAMAKWQELAAKGDPAAQFRLGHLMIARADVKGLPMVRASAGAGYLPAELAMATFKQSGMYVPKNEKSAITRLRRVVEADAEQQAAHRSEAARARALLGEAYRAGTGVAVDMAKSNRLIREAADAGCAHSQFRYANLLEAGDGIERDLVTAHLYFVLLWKQDVPGATELARPRAIALRKRMSKAQLDASRAKIREWMEAKEAGKLGWLFGHFNRRSEGLEIFNQWTELQSYIHMVMLGHDQRVSKACKTQWLLSRSVSKGTFGQGKWTETWTIDRCGEPVGYQVHFTARGENLDWTFFGERAGRP